jgi:hypothetical protein
MDDPLFQVFIESKGCKGAQRQSYRVTPKSTQFEFYSLQNSFIEKITQ